MTGVLTYQLLTQQDDVTSRVVQELLDSNPKFHLLAKTEAASLIERDRQDATKLREGIQRAVQRGLLDVVPPGKAFPIHEVDVHNKTADTVASEILAHLPSHQRTGNSTSGGLLVTLQGLSGTGKGTTVQKLRHALGGTKACVAWSNGNVFRALTWLLTQRFLQEGEAAHTTTPTHFVGKSSSLTETPSPKTDRRGDGAMRLNQSGQTFEQFIANPEVLTYCASQLRFDRRCDLENNTSPAASLMCGFDVIMEVEGELPVTSPVKTVPRLPGTCQESSDDALHHRILYASDVAETLLKDAIISSRVPFVAGFMQGEVLQFTRRALEILQASGVHVILEGREETLQYISTPYRFELIHSQAEHVLGKRRAAQRVMALAQEHIQAEACGENNKEHSSNESVAITVLEKALSELSETSVPRMQTESVERVEKAGGRCGCC